MTDTLATRLREALGSDYTLERELGGGGMSRVFVATESALGRRVVVKVLPPDLAAGVNKERFRREIQLAAQLQHPHVVPLLTAGERGDLLWFTMPFIEGESLRMTLDERKRLPVRDVLRILRNVVDALAYAHGRGVVHRDIKPGNILMSGTHAVVTDFGVAKALSAAIPVAGHTTSGMAIGSPAYMAPEQLAADPAADHRVDIYAVGLLAYELLAGIAPFSGSSPQATLAAQLTVRPTAPHVAQSDIPPALSALIMHCLEKDASQRPQTASALLHELDAVEITVRDEAASAAYATSARSRHAMIAVLAVVAVATSIFAITRDRPQAELLASARNDTTGRAAAAETVVVFRDVPVGRDQAEGITLPLGLSRAESLQIAQQMGSRTTPGDAPASARADIVDRDSLLAAVSRIFADSLQRAIESMQSEMASLPRQLQLQTLVTQSLQGAGGATGSGSARDGFRFEIRQAPGAGMVPDSGQVDARERAADARTRAMSSAIPLIQPPPPGTHRLAILPFSSRTRDPALVSLGGALMDSIAAALRGSRGRLEVLSTDATRDLVGETSPNRTTAIGFSLRANYVLSGTYFVRNDSVVVIAVLTDVQNGSGTRLNAEEAPIGTATATLAPTATWVRARLDTLRREAVMREPGRRPPPDGMRESPQRQSQSHP